MTHSKNKSYKISERNVLSGGFLSRGFLAKGVLSRGFLSEGLCPGGFCLGGFCPRTVEATLNITNAMAIWKRLY